MIAKVIISFLIAVGIFTLIALGRQEDDRSLHCSSMACKDKSTYLDFKTIKYMLEKYKPEWVNISGGEPLLHKDIIDINK